MHSRRAFFGLIGIGAVLAPFAKAIASTERETGLEIASNGVTISTAKTLSEWRNGSDVTVIEGSRIMPANITADRVVFGPHSCIRLID